jgi:hypothetical protein
MQTPQIKYHYRFQNKLGYHNKNHGSDLLELHVSIYVYCNSVNVDYAEAQLQTQYKCLITIRTSGNV